MNTPLCDGRIETAITAGGDDNSVCLEFADPVTEVSLSPDQARALATSLVRWAIKVDARNVR
jgi:hypothetical protein